MAGNISRSVVQIFGAKATNAVLAFVGIAFFAQTLGAAQLGVFFLFEAAVGVIGMVSDFGLQESTEKRISEGEHPGGVLSTAILLKAALLVPASALVLLFSGWLNAFIGAEVTTLLVGTLVIREFAQLMVRVLMGELRVGETAVLRLSRTLTWVGLGAALVLSGFDAVGLIYAFAAGFGVMFAWAAARCETGLARPSIAHARSLLSYSKHNFISVVGEYMYNWADLAIIGLLLTQTHVGIYEVAWRLTQVVTLISTSIGMTIFPQISAWSVEEGVERIESLLTDGMTSSLVLVIPAFVGAMLLSTELLRVLFGAEYTGAALVLVVLMGNRVFYAVYVLLWRVMKGVDRPDLVARATAFTVGLNLVLNILLVTRFGILGAAFATGIAAVVNTALNARYVSRFMRLRFNVGEIGWSVLSAAVMGLVLLPIRGWLDVNAMPVLLGVVALGVLLYGVTLMGYGPLRLRILEQARVVLRQFAGPER